MSTSFPTFQRLVDQARPFATLRPWRTSNAQQRSLVRLLSVAAEENLPLGSLVRAWAVDEPGIQSGRLHKLADLLSEGIPLPDAVEAVPGALGDEDILAVRFGAQSGTLAATLRDRLDEAGVVSERLAVRMRKLLIYVIVIGLIGLFIVTFIQIKIMPMFTQIMSEFGLDKPPLMELSIAVAYYAASYWYVILFLLLAIGWLIFASWPGRRLRQSVWARIFWPLRELHTADVLRKLGVTINAGRPIAGALSTLARYHFDPLLRRQLLFLRNEVEQGADMWQSMASIGMLSPPEARALATADRVGNRPWVLRQIAAVKKQRTSRRLTQLSELVFPATIICLGMFVLLQALGIFSPLVHILRSLGC